MSILTSKLAPSESSFFWPPAMSRRFWPVAILFYGCALAANFTYVFNDKCGFAFFPGRTGLFVSIIVLLIGFELWSYYRFGATMTRGVGIGLLITRMVLIEAAISLDCSAFSLFLYMLIIFLAYFFLNHWGSLLLVGLYYGWFLIMFIHFRCPECGFDDLVTQIFMVGLAMLWSVVMAGLVKGAEISRARAQQLLLELEESQRQLKSYAAQAWELATAEERNRLARDIHDSIGHYLAGVNIQLEKALTFHQRDPAAAARAMEDAKHAAQEALRDVRQSVRALRQTSEVFSLSTALTDLADRWRDGRLIIKVTLEGDEANYPKATLMALYRVVQEGLTNVHKYAQASEVRIRLRMGAEMAHLCFSDNGQGFAQEVDQWLPTPAGHHYGLQGIHERLALLNGTFVIDSRPGDGTSLTVTIPRRPEAKRPEGEI